MELIPQLRRLGYRWALVDSAHAEPEGSMRWEQIRYQPHIARFAGEQIIVIVRDRELSDAQESGMDYAWFEREVRARTRWCDFPPLVSTCSDGDNGGWFRNVNPAANFWGAFYGELLARARTAARSNRCSSTSTCACMARTATSRCVPARGIPAGMMASASLNGPAHSANVTRSPACVR
jgi:hypothetical protein